jgi:hypothetical protein
VWGWSLTGLLIGYELQTRSPEKDSQSKVQRKVIKKQQVSALAVVTSFIFGGLGLAAAIPPYSAAGKFYKALQSGDAEVIQPAAYLQPNDRARYLYVARIMIDNKLYMIEKIGTYSVEKSKKIIRTIVDRVPDTIKKTKSSNNIQTSSENSKK